MRKLESNVSYEIVAKALRKQAQEKKRAPFLMDYLNAS